MIDSADSVCHDVRFLVTLFDVQNAPFVDIGVLVAVVFSLDDDSLVLTVEAVEEACVC